ncbi:relaxase/mobilization nuclease domain-containing protein [Sphingomonas sp. RB3P16]|uniref:relaxase/mobilization nuclease domain-containing protein n=1 Tax=Parasphingomonas frigoris TaxID=3096163 RepID=UPI002FC84FF8
MSFRFSSGTMDSMAGVFAPPKKYRLGTGGGSAKGPKTGGTMLGLAVASVFPKPASSTIKPRPGAQAKHAFGGGSQARVNGRAVTTLDRTSRRVPEVMVRITGRQHGGGHVLANFAYISRLGHGPDEELGLETSEGVVLRDGRDMQILAKDWHNFEMDGDARRKGATSISMILSMPTGTDPQRLKAAALDFAREEFANRSWVAGLHVDRDHPHVHITIARRDFDGRRFHPDRDDLFRWRQRFAEKLRERGIEANATPTRARGIDPAHEHIAVQKMRDKGQVPRLDRSRAERAQRLCDHGDPDPVEAILSSRQATVRATYMRSVEELSASPSLADQVVAQSLKRFLAALPPPEPNSARAVRWASPTRVRDGAIIDVQTRPAAAGIGLDPIAAALERSRAMREKLEAKQVFQEKLDPAEDTPLERRPSGVSDRLRSLMDEAERQFTTPIPSKPEEVLREIMDRDRAARDRERSPDRDGLQR